MHRLNGKGMLFYVITFPPNPNHPIPVSDQFRVTKSWYEFVRDRFKEELKCPC
jgi:hypothetical protein